MYRYDEFDEALVRARAGQFRDQVARRLSGELSEEQFKPLRLMNGVYQQLHAYMLRVAIPYGQLDADKMRALADISERYDRSYGHFTTRQNIQFNWISLNQVPDILDDLADVGMHAIQTSGNCVRNVTSDEFAGACRDEIADPRPWCELVRQWSSLHAEFCFLPRKFKIAVTGAKADRAAVRLHDIGLIMRAGSGGQIGFEIIVGGGQGRTPHIGATIAQWVPAADLIDWLEAILRVYNRHGRRDNIYKARIKILLSALGADAFAGQVRAELDALRAAGRQSGPPDQEISRIASCFAPPRFADAPESDLAELCASTPGLAAFAATNLHAHRQSGYTSVVISLKAPGAVPGDATAAQMRVVADLAEQFGHNDIRVSHAQNLVLPHVRVVDLPVVFAALDGVWLATANVGLASDIICCPGLDYCNLANTRSIPVAQEIADVLSALEQDTGRLHINISGCINACGHHHVGHIGILGVDRRGEENYQITLGGRADQHAAIGRIAGPGLRADQVPSAIRRVVRRYLDLRQGPQEDYIDTLGRIGTEPFVEAIYAADPD